METKWCFDEQGQRSVSAAEQVAIGISEKIMQHPQLMEGNNNINSLFLVIQCCLVPIFLLTFLGEPKIH